MSRRDDDEMKVAGYIVRPDPDAPYQPEQKPPKPEPAWTSAPQFGEPWRITDEAYEFSPVSFYRADCHPVGITGNQKNMERAKICVNAMANIPDPQGFVDSVRKLLEDCHDGFDWLQDGHDCCTAFPLKQRISAMLARLDAWREP